MRILLAAITIAGAFAPTNAISSEILSMNEAKALVSGSTLEFTKKGREVRAYYDPDGYYVSVSKTGGRSGDWKIKENGAHCVDWGDGWKCSHYRKTEEGGYEKVKLRRNGKIKKILFAIDAVKKGNIYGL